MKSSAVLFAILLLCCTAILPSRASAAASSPPIDMGYGPSTLFPVSTGTPVYTAGEELWARSHFNSSIQVDLGPVLFSSASPTVYDRTLQPGVPVRLLNFNSSTLQGPWYLRFINVQHPELYFVVSDAASTPANLSLAAYRLLGSSVVLNLTTSRSLQMYDVRACVLGRSPASMAKVELPSGIGSGYVNISRSGDSVAVESFGSGVTNYSLSVELDRSFSFLVPNSTSTLVTREVRVATTGAVPMSGGRSSLLPLLPDLAIEPGVYQVRALFQGSSGTSLSTADVLIGRNQGWVWLGACRSYPVYSSDFSLSLSLRTDPSEWPRSVLLTYRVFGNEGVASTLLGLNFAAVDFLGAPFGVKLSGYKINLANSSGIQQSSVSNGTAYAVLDAPSAQVGYSAGLGNHVFFTGMLGPIAPFTETAVSLEVGKLAVQYLVGGAGYEGGSVRLSDTSGPLATATTDGTGHVVFYLPAGRYNLTAVGGNGSASGSTSVSAGETQTILLSPAGSSEPGPIVLAGLVAVAAVGAAANVTLWARERKRASGHALSPSQK